MKWMLNLSVEVKGKNTLVTLEGQIDETFSLEKELPEPGESLDLNCLKINRINSTGVKKWMQYLQSIMKKSKIKFLAVSPALIEQFNLISNFGANGEVVSIALPYGCTKCGSVFTVVKTVSELTKIHGQVGNEKCPHCGDLNSEFDDVPEEYLSFLEIK
jgi:hypothetical protein